MGRTWEVTKQEVLGSTWQLISRLEGASAMGVTEKTGFWRQLSACSDTLDSRRPCRTSGVMFWFYRHKEEHGTKA